MENESDLRNFFPATSDNFVPACGAIKSLKTSDFQDTYRKRHLESFKKSCDEWLNAPKKVVINEELLLCFTKSLVMLHPETPDEFDSAMVEARRIYKVCPTKSQILRAYEKIKQDSPEYNLEKFLLTKAVRTHSGVLVITVLTSPGQFSCPNDCHYCPNEPGQPRSYLSTEPAVLRGNQNGWDPALQFWDRALTLYNNGHIIDKIEVLVLGGTWSGYPASYQEEFIRDLFYAANTFQDFISGSLKGTHFQKKRERKNINSEEFSRNIVISENVRGPLSLEIEQTRNEKSSCRIIGLTLETRPDKITLGELRRLRQFGCTRVQIGIQHTDNNILKKINRGCDTSSTIRALKLLKDACFKVDIHIMPDLPGSNLLIDRDMFNYILSSPELQADQWKIYPCEVTPFSEIEKWYKNEEFVPYAEKDDGESLSELIIKVKSAIHPWIRLNRIIRDIPNPSIIAGNNKTNLRQIILDEMRIRQLKCRCLRCREVKTAKTDKQNVVLKIRKYPSNGGDEFFLSIESPNELQLFGFLRLRIRQKKNDMKNNHECNLMDETFPELKDCGLIRELHVYGQLVGSTERKDCLDNRSQHTGFGKKLLIASEIITVAHKLNKIAVIAGVGTRDYYRKFDYETEKWYMTKHLDPIKVNLSAEAVNISLPIQVQIYNLETDIGDFPQTRNAVRKWLLEKKKKKKGTDYKTIPSTNMTNKIKIKSHAVKTEYVYTDKIMSYKHGLNLVSTIFFPWSKKESFFFSEKNYSKENEKQPYNKMNRRVLIALGSMTLILTLKCVLTKIRQKN